MGTLIIFYVVFSLALLLGAAVLERRGILAMEMKPNGKAMLLALAVSAGTGLALTLTTLVAWGWVNMLHVLGGVILYHAVMGIFLVHGLQEVSARAYLQTRS